MVNAVKERDVIVYQCGDEFSHRNQLGLPSIPSLRPAPLLDSSGITSLPYGAIQAYVRVICGSVESSRSCGSFRVVSGVTRAYAQD